MSRIRSPSSAPWVNGELGSIESTATWRSAARTCSTSLPISVDLPTPGGPVNPTTAARPVFGYTSRTSAQPSGIVVLDQRDGPRERTPVAASRRSARSAAVRPGRGTGGNSTARLRVPRTPAPSARCDAARVGECDQERCRCGRAAEARLADRRMAVVEVAVPADPPERGARVVLPRLGPAGEPGDVVPGAARAGQDVHGEPERMLAERLVADRPEPLPDLHVVAADEVEDVRQDAAVDPRPGLPRDLDQAAAAREPREPADRAGRPVVHVLAAEVEEVAHLGRDRVLARGRTRRCRCAVADVDRVVAVAGIDEGAGGGGAGRALRRRACSQGLR